MPALQQHQQILLPQSYLTNFHNRIRNEDVAMLVTAQPTRGHKRAKVVNYAEFDNDIFDDFSNLNNGNNEAGENGGDDEERSGSNNNGNTNSGNNDDNDDNDDNDNHGHGSGNSKSINNNKLPDIEEQDDQLSILKYPKIRETFLQSKIAVPYRLNLTMKEQIQDEKMEEPIIIPISLNVEHNGHTISDYFTWNINDHSITPDEFATIYLRDLDFTNAQALHSQIVSSITEQIQEHETLAAMRVENDLQVIINLTCNLENRFFEDNFQWNLNDSSLTPEAFAEIVTADLGLMRDFIPLIAHSLHESLLRVKKEWIEGHLNQESVHNDAAFGYLAGIRLDIDELGANWCPRVEILTQEEIQRREIEKERNMRRLKRESDRLSRRGRRRLDDLETTMRI